MIQVFVTNVYSRLSDYTEELEKHLTVPYPKYWFSQKYKMGLWDGMYHFLKIPSLKFPTGLLFLVEEFSQQAGLRLEVVDQRHCPISDLGKALSRVSPRMLSGIVLRDYQVEAVRAAVSQGRGILELPTGSGKTEIAIAITKALGLRTLFLVHTRDLLYQTAERFRKRLDSGARIGIIGDQEFEVEEITVATVQSLSSRMKSDLSTTRKLLSWFEVMFQDETHHSSAPTFFKIGMFMHNAYFRMGLSGTALRRDVLSNMKVMALTGDIIYRLQTTELIERGTLSDIEIRMIENPEIVSGTTWQQIYERGVIQCLVRNNKIAQIATTHWREGRKVMILVRQIEHGELLRDLLEQERQVPAKFVWGRHASVERERVKEEFNRDGNFVLIASPIYDEGVDLPEVNVLIMAAGGKSEVKTLQKIGRGLRRKRDHSTLLVYDFNDSGAKYLSKHSVERLKTYQKEGFKVKEVAI